jgi:hypothetical protein
MRRLDSQLALERIKAAAQERGGVCLAGEYKNTQSIFRFRCKDGHEWTLTYNAAISKKSWCWECNGRKALDPIQALLKVQAVVKKQGGKCLSTSKDYLGSLSKFLIECKEGHQWRATFGHIVHTGSWCGICAKSIRNEANESINRVELFAQSKGGRYISGEYVNARSRLLIECEVGHRWDTIYSNIIYHNHWCPYCSGRSGHTIERLYVLAANRGGECLSTKYTNVHTKYTWVCKNSHEWQASANNINRGHWCPSCLYKNEQEYRGILERLTKHRFPKTRKILGKMNSKGRARELDGYCEELKVAFEYHGEQHYEFVKHFHKGKKTLDKQQQIDSWKRLRCNELGVKLIEIPYWVEDKVAFIEQCLADHNLLPNG